MTADRPQAQAASWYGAKDAAALLGISRATLYRHAADGRLATKVRKANGRRVFSGASLISLWAKLA